MPAPAVESRDAQPRRRTPIKQARDRRARHRRVIHQREQHPIRIRGHGAQAAVHRCKLPQTEIRIRNEQRLASAAQSGDHRIPVRAHHGNHGRATLRKQADQPVQKRLPLNLQQRLGRAHAARLARRQYQSAGHFNNSARGNSPVNTDLESARQPESALRRTAIISATTDTAISSGETAPISSPIGANTRAKLSSEAPSFSSSLTTLITLRLLPIMAMYRALVETAQRSTSISSRWPRVTM